MTDEQSPDQPEQIFRTADFRYYYSNHMRMRITENEFQLIFGMVEDNNLKVEQCAAIIPPKLAKLLAKGLANFVQAYEMKFGEIPFDENSIATPDALKDSFQDIQKKKG